MSGTGYTIKNAGSGNSEAVKTYNVVPADGTIDVERTEANNEVQFAIKTTYDGYEVINGGSPYRGGYYRLIHIKFNQTNRRYRLVCILNGGSYTPVAEDFAFYYIKFGWGTGGVNSDHWYIQEYSRQGNGAFVALEQISKSEYNVLLHTPTGYANANIGILKEDKEPDVTIEHFNPQTTTYTPTGSIITTATPNWKNGSPAVWSVIPDVQNPVIGQLGHYYAADRNLYFYDGYNWHNVYSLAQGVASMLATTDAPATANDGTIYYDTTEQNLKIWYNGGWQNIITVSEKALMVLYNNLTIPSIIREGMLSTNTNDYYGQVKVWNGSSWQPLRMVASSIYITSNPPNSGANGNVCFSNSNKSINLRVDGAWQKVITDIDLTEQVVTFTDYSGETIAANDTAKIIVTAAFGANSILDFTNIEKVDGKTIEITILSGSIIRVKDGATGQDLNGCNESVVKCICINNSWSFYKVSGITQVQ